MRDPRLAPARIRVDDAATLEERARALARAESDRDGDALASTVSLVRFTVGGLDCAVEARIVERALARLPIAVAVSVSAAPGGERAFVFVDERPLPVADLSGAVAGAARQPARLTGSAALILATSQGPVAVAVDGPLELSEERLSGTTPAGAWGAGGGVRLSGRLADGASVISAGWMIDWASRGGA